MADATKAQNLLARKPLTQERLKEVLHYDPTTGSLSWRVNIYAGEHHTRIVACKGNVAGYVGRSGTSKSEYVFIRIDGVLYGAHSLVWFYVTGEFPGMLDHRDLDGTNNRFENLRPCDKSTNAANTGPPINNTSGVKGVTWDKSRQQWAVEIRCRNVRYRLGRFLTLSEAASAYREKAKELFGEFARAA